ncbi:MAG: 6-phospho-beta-glucosidase, partial [Propionicimonas sp.]|nr:6-phospho-beta-glucosidase [Propionicimonas sp.]
PGLLGSDAALAQIEEARLLGFDWVRALGALPNEYLYYYYFTREAVARIRSEPQTRGEFLDAQQSRFYAAPGDSPLQTWQAVHGEREATYMAESRAPEEQRQASDLGGGYQEVALDLMAALATGRGSTMILNVRNGTLVPALPQEAVIEVGCTVDGNGIRPWPVAPVVGEQLGLIAQVKAAEQLVIAAAREGSRRLAWRAFAAHPLVDSVAIARRLVDGYTANLPDLARLLS